MMKQLSRRDFLKLGWKTFESAIASGLVVKSARASASANTKPSPNIVLLICDAMTAQNLSLYGYSRKTTPNLEKLAEKAFVYHVHRSNGSFTTAGTASLLTGLLPWTHRAINPAGIVRRDLSRHNIFNFLGNNYFKAAYTQNYWANYLLNQFLPNIDDLLPYSEFGLVDIGIVNQKFKNDNLIAYRALEKMLYNDSLLLSFITGISSQQKIINISSEEYPDGFPFGGYYNYPFTMKDLFNGIANKIFELDALESPFFSYFHVFPPHYPYRAQKDFFGMFEKDSYHPIVKHEHVLSSGASQSRLDGDRNQYDAFIANLDMEIGRLVDKLKEQGILEHTYFIIASDHGEMFERGTYAHFTPLLYEPVVRIPLIILPPGNQARRDFITPTSNVDLMPTILNIAGQEIPNSCEGSLLPGFGGAENSKRSIFMMDAKESFFNKPFTKATYSIAKGNLKLIYYHGYQHKYNDYYEFYDIQEDPEEMNDKYSKPRYSSIVEDLKKELSSAIDAANKKL